MEKREVDKKDGQRILLEDELKELSPYNYKLVHKELLDKILKNIHQPEEKVRYYWILKLIKEYGYSSKQIDINVPAGGGRNRSNIFADIVVYRDIEKTEPFIVGEVKALGKKDNIDGEQAASYARNIGAEYHFWSNKTTNKFWRTAKFQNKSIIIGNIPVWVGKRPAIQKVKKTEELPPFKDIQELRQVVSVCHDLIYREGHDPAYAFDELTKLLFLKLYDERETPNYYEFVALANESQVETVARINKLFKKATNEPKYKDVFLTRYNKVKEINLDLMPQTIYAIAQQLQGYSLVNTTENIQGADIKGTVYETMVGGTFRGELGQYFTPRQLVEFMVEMSNPTKNDKILDPACGSGGFLIMSIKYIKDKIRKENPNLSDAEISSQIKYFCEHNVYGLDINPRMTRVAKMNMIMHGDGHAGIFNLNGLLAEKNMPRRVEEELIGESIDIIFSNPPFAGYENNPEFLKQFNLGKNKEDGVRSVTPEILFIERIIKLLKYGGRCCLVLPLGIFTNPSSAYKEIRDYIKEHTKILAVIGLPTWVFSHTDTGVNGALLFLEKVREVPKSYDIFYAWAENVGYTSTGRKTEENDFPKIYQNYKRMKEENIIDNKQIKNISKFLELKEDLPFYSRIIRFSKDDKEDTFNILKDRIDPEYYHPKYEALLIKLKSSKYKLIPLSNVIKLKENNKSFIKSNPNKMFYYLENNDIDFVNKKIISRHMFLGNKMPSRSKYILEEGDFLIPNAKESLKGIMVTPKECGGYVATSRFYVFKPLINPIYLYELLNSKLFLNLLRRESSGEIALTINDDVFEHFLIPLPEKEELEYITMDMIKEDNKILQFENDLNKLKKQKEINITRLVFQ